MEFQNICNEMVAPFLLRHPVGSSVRDNEADGREERKEVTHQGRLLTYFLNGSTGVDPGQDQTHKRKVQFFLCETMDFIRLIDKSKLEFFGKLHWCNNCLL